MNGAAVYVADSTSTLPEMVPSWSECAMGGVALAQGEDYSRVLSYESESVSWQTVHTMADMEMRRRFTGLAKRWEGETINLSSVEEIILNSAYQSIIAIGPVVIPLILEQLQRKPDFWFWALRHLTGEDPITEDMRGDVRAMTDAWLEWGREHANS